MKKFIGISLGLILGMCTPAMAQQVQCMPMDDLVSSLTEDYQESVQVEGVTSNGFVMQIFSNIETGSWTAVMHRPDSISCVVSSGMFFFDVPNPPNL